MSGVNITDAGSVSRAMTEIRVRDAGNIDRVLTEVRVIGPDGMDRVVYGQFAAGASPTSVSVKGNSATTVTLTTRTTTAFASFPVGAVTYAWTQLSGDPMTITNPSGATTAFSAAVAPGGILSGVFQCAIADAGGHSGTVSVNATIVNLYGGLA